MVTSFVLGVFSIIARADCLNLPVGVPERIGRVQLFLNQIADKSVLAGKYDLIWVDYFYKPGWAKVSGIYSTKYMMADRDPNPFARIANPSGGDGFSSTRDFHWYRQNHPDWVMYKCPGEPEPPMCRRPASGPGPNNPAYSCFYSNSVDYVPLDITNPAVREFLFQANLGEPPYSPPFRAYTGKDAKPVLYPSPMSSGLYDAVGVDNLASENSFGECGIYRGNKFVRSYSGAKTDPAFLHARIDWLNWLRHKVNAEGLCLIGNDYFTTGHSREFLEIASALDIVMDEHGFTRDSGPLETGAQWLTRIETLRHLTESGKSLIVVDY
ncbi:MAG: hypothetical protein ACREFC_10245, partial [Stellaceae bacterium]